MTNPTETKGFLITGRKARFYDFENTFYGVPFVNRKHLSLIQLRPGDRLLDVGCGTAEVICRLYQRFGAGVSLAGVDPSTDIIAVARQKTQHYPSVSVNVGVAERLGYDDHSFDWVISCLTTHHLPLPEKRAMLRECHRVLRPGGRLLITDFGKPGRFFGRLMAIPWRNHVYARENMNDVMVGLVQESGFRQVASAMQFGLVQHITAHK